MKMFAAVFLSLSLCLSLLAAGPRADRQAEEPVSTPAPVVTLEPIDPNPEPPLESQDDPTNPPKPGPIHF